MPYISLAKAKRLKRTGDWRSDRYPVRLDWSELDYRPQLREPKDKRSSKKWIRCAADERAYKDGAWFSLAQAKYVEHWFKKHLCHAVGEWSGKPFELMKWQRDEIIYPLFGWYLRNDRGNIARRHKRTWIEIPKKNGKSTLASGVGLWMLCNNGNTTEVYSYAADRSQASIVHGMAIKMVAASPTLQWYFKYSTHLNEIKCEEPDHFMLYKAEASRPAASEGKIGVCAIADELHAWYGRELWESMEKVGLNWNSPLLFCITTAGNDPMSIAYELHDQALAQEAGTQYDPDLLTCIHAADPGDDLRDPAVQDKANPSMGQTISRERLNAYIERAAGFPRRLDEVKRYYFNIWMRSSSRWLSDADWKACAGHNPHAPYRPKTERKLKGLDCVAGLDLARKSDVTALAMVFTDDTVARLRVWAWLPEATADNLRQLVNYHEWAEQGWIRLTPGEVTNYDIVEDDIRELMETYRPSALGYDEHYAEELTQRLMFDSDCERIAIAQTMKNFAGPTVRLEQMIIGRQVSHIGNPLLAWQVGNVKVKEDQDGGIRPIKAGRDDHNTIDGVVAAIMALSVLGEAEGVDDYYETHHALII